MPASQSHQQARDGNAPETQHEVDLSKIAAWLSPLDDFQCAQGVAHRRHLRGTGQWLLDSEAFQRWLAGKHKHMVCFGEGKEDEADPAAECLR